MFGIGVYTQVEGTHGASGGAPGTGDKPPGYTLDKDITGAVRSDCHIRTRAGMSNVPISPREDYGYPGPDGKFNPPKTLPSGTGDGLCE